MSELLKNLAANPDWEGVELNDDRCNDVIDKRGWGAMRVVPPGHQGKHVCAALDKTHETHWLLIMVFSQFDFPPDNGVIINYWPKSKYDRKQAGEKAKEIWQAGGHVAYSVETPESFN